MKPTDSLSTLFAHNRWANLRLLEQCSTLTPEQLDATTTGAYGSIRDTLEHIVMAERGYLSRIRTGLRYEWPDGARPESVAAMAALAEETGTALIESVARVTPTETVEIDWNGTLRDVPKTILVTQAINHATEHRDQVFAILTSLGIDPPDLSGWSYFEETDG